MWVIDSRVWNSEGENRYQSFYQFVPTAFHCSVPGVCVCALFDSFMRWTLSYHNVVAVVFAAYYDFVSSSFLSLSFASQLKTISFVFKRRKKNYKARAQKRAHLISIQQQFDEFTVFYLLFSVHAFVAFGSKCARACASNTRYTSKIITIAHCARSLLSFPPSSSRLKWLSSLLFSFSKICFSWSRFNFSWQNKRLFAHVHRTGANIMLFLSLSLRL